ncbi:hypothetical protein [Bathymodiolus septemdierum thioautotrophic gill symbiont]|nr:hypothetical protein [Bathymodiolus septemdierum thioautotrophic gill symbiont]
MNMALSLAIIVFSKNLSPVVSQRFFVLTHHTEEIAKAASKLTVGNS